MVTRLPGTAQWGSIAVITGGTDLVVVELDVPVHVVSPALRRVAQSERDSGGGRLVGTARTPNQAHPGLLGCPTTLAAVAIDAARDDVLPVLASGLRHRHDVVERQVRRQERLSAVLAGV